ncbi:MAG: hypothetical protein LBT75_04725 [Bacilli bacterium]|jgi:hypothetical protein|nr:hypothetical protein [Bacilli bacterium]
MSKKIKMMYIFNLLFLCLLVIIIGGCDNNDDNYVFKRTGIGMNEEVFDDYKRHHMTFFDYKGEIDLIDKSLNIKELNLIMEHYDKKKSNKITRYFLDDFYWEGKTKFHFSFANTNYAENHDIIFRFSDDSGSTRDSNYIKFKSSDVEGHYYLRNDDLKTIHKDDKIVLAAYDYDFTDENVKKEKLDKYIIIYLEAK